MAEPKDIVERLEAAADRDGASSDWPWELLREAAAALRAEAERLERAAAQRDHIIATIIVNLQRGATPADVLAWWEKDAKKQLQEPRAHRRCIRALPDPEASDVR